MFGHLFNNIHERINETIIMLKFRKLFLEPQKNKNKKTKKKQQNPEVYLEISLKAKCLKAKSRQLFSQKKFLRRWSIGF